MLQLLGLSRCLKFDPLEEEERVLVGVPSQHLPEEGAAGRQDHLDTGT